MSVDLYDAGNSAKELSSEYNVSRVTIYKWIKELTSIEQWEDSLTPNEVATIQKENLQLKQELDILKKGYSHIREKVKDRRIRTYCFKRRATRYFSVENVLAMRPVNEKRVS